MNVHDFKDDGRHISVVISEAYSEPELIGQHFAKLPNAISWAIKKLEKGENGWVADISNDLTGENLLELGRMGPGVVVVIRDDEIVNDGRDWEPNQKEWHERTLLI